MFTYFVFSSSTRDPELIASQASRRDYEIRRSCRSAAYTAMGTMWSWSCATPFTMFHVCSCLFFVSVLCLLLSYNPCFSIRKRRCVQTSDCPFGLGWHVRRSTIYSTLPSSSLPPSGPSSTTGLAAVTSGAFDIPGSY